MGDCYDALKDYPSARVHYQEVIHLLSQETDPAQRELSLHRLGLAYIGLGEYETAIEVFQDLATTNPTALDLIGTCYKEWGNPQLALTYYQKYLEFYPHDAMVFRKIAGVYRQLKDYITAIEWEKKYYRRVRGE